MGRCIVVTGASGPVGAAVTRHLREQDHTVITVDVSECDVTADFTTASGRRQAIDAIAKAIPNQRVDAVVACAEVAEERPEAVRANYFGVTEITTALRPQLAKSDAPRVVVIGNVAALHNSDIVLVEACLAGDPDAVDRRLPYLTDRGYVLYPSAKAALHRWARRIAPQDEWAGEGITVNVVAPSIAHTNDDANPDTAVESLLNATVPAPLGQVTPDAIADVATFLASAENTHVTGQIIYVDGGVDVIARGEEYF